MPKNFFVQNNFCTCVFRRIIRENNNVALPCTYEQRYFFINKKTVTETSNIRIKFKVSFSNEKNEENTSKLWMKIGPVFLVLQVRTCHSLTCN